MHIRKTQAERILKQALNSKQAEFRDGQWEAIDEIVNNNNKILVVQRTGWGKSAVYFITSRIFKEQNRGLTVIISPLLSLMRNQVDSGSKFGVTVVSINSSNTDEWDEHIQRIKQGKVDCLIVAPERLANYKFNERVLERIQSKIALFVVDEAHCISNWGHDFRPDYRRIVSILKNLPKNTPVLCTTATANKRVVGDIKDQIGNIKILKGSLVRDNLKLYSYPVHNKATRLAHLIQLLNKIDGTGIIYTLTTRDSKVVSNWLKSKNIQAEPYTGRMENEEREELENKLLRNKVKALVATSALGMGYDKPDLSFVIHYQTPSSIIDYYQQVGRAGRGINSAVGIVFLGAEDDKINEHFRETAFPRADNIREILNVLENSLSTTEIEKYTNLKPTIIKKTLKFLSVVENPPIIKSGSKWAKTTHPYSLDEIELRDITEKRLEEWKQMLDYVKTKECKMAFLQKSLDDNNIIQGCGICQSCQNKEFNIDWIPKEDIESASIFLKKIDFPIEPRKKWPAKEIFQDYNLAEKILIPKELLHQQGRVLSIYGEGIGKDVKNCKIEGVLNDTLVESFINMIKRHDFDCQPKWICYVPSHNTKMVKNFSHKVAEKIGIPCYDIIHKIKSNQPQKRQQNTYQQAKNLDGVFAVCMDGMPRELFSQPCFLIDDIVDSKWTLTVLSALLRQQGSGLVIPLALATAEVG